VYATPNTFKASARKICNQGEIKTELEGEAQCTFSTDLCLLRAAQLGEYSSHALSLCISDGPKTIPRIRTDNKTGDVGGDKA